MGSHPRSGDSRVERVEVGKEPTEVRLERGLQQVSTLPIQRFGDCSQDEKEAFQQYMEKFGECRDGSNPGEAPSEC